MKKIRVATHAGSWYTDKPQILKEQLNNYLAQTKSLPNFKNIKGIIGPHAGYFYSGLTAAFGYKYLTTIPKESKLNIFLLGPSHHKYFKGCALSILDEVQTPFGNIPINTELITKIKTQGRFVQLRKSDEQKQHSLQMHLPYIKKTLGENISVIPIIVGDTQPEDQTEYGRIFAEYFDKQDSLFIISSDFCHWGKRFDFTYYNEDDGEIWQSIEKLDKKGIQLIQNNKHRQFWEYINQTENTICGRHPIGIYLQTVRLSKLKNLKTKFVKYAQSEPVKTVKNSSVSYASGVTYIEQ